MYPGQSHQAVPVSLLYVQLDPTWEQLGLGPPCLGPELSGAARFLFLFSLSPLTKPIPAEWEVCSEHGGGKQSSGQRPGGGWGWGSLCGGAWLQP